MPNIFLGPLEVISIPRNGGPLEWRTLGMADPLNGGPSEWRTLGMADRNRLGLDKHLRRSSGSYFHTPEWRTLGMAYPLNGGSSEWRTP